MSEHFNIGETSVGKGQPTYVVAEIGINHNGDMEIVKGLIDAAHRAGVDAVKFQKRTPELCVPPDQQKRKRETPWGYITYLEYRHKVEFEADEYQEIDRYCRKTGIAWFASVWDETSVDFLEAFDPVVYKIPSATCDPVDRHVHDGRDTSVSRCSRDRRSAHHTRHEHIPV